MKNCCVVITTHKEKLSSDEEKSFSRALEVFKGKDIKLIIPNNVSTEYFNTFKNQYNFEILGVNQEWQSDYKAYNRMCCNKEFYELFKDYEYVLIYQTDCWVFEDRLDYFMELGYDWYGAPWPFSANTVGNGGLSLRRVKKMIEITSSFKYDDKINEDWWFCQKPEHNIKKCPWEIAVNFSLELPSKLLISTIKKLPMGFHGKKMIEYWDETGKKFNDYKKKLSMKISVITINLNNKNGLERTINSVINQTAFENIEYIIIDGNSTDGSKEVIEHYKDKITYYVSEKDEGLYDAMNKGCSKATGKYCLFLNSGDNFWTNNVVEQMIPYLDKDIVFGNLIINEKLIKKYPDKISDKYWLYDTLPHPSSFIKTSLIKKLKYDKTYKIISDWIFFRKSICEMGKTYKHVPIPVSNFFLGGISKDENKIKEEKSRYYNNLKDYDYEICVVIPCYNQDKYVKETIDSLKKQIYEDFHCIIVNDGSTDNSEEVILENIKDDKRFEYYKNENHGLSYTRNFGIGKTNSKYILCLDSDDKISTAYIECAVRYLNKHPETSLFYGNALMFYDDGKMNFWKLPKFSYSSIFKMNTIYCSSVYRRKDYERVGGYDETMKAYEDWEFLIRLLHNNDNVYRTDDIVFYYRRHDDSMDANAKKDVVKYKEYIIEKNKRIYDELRKNESPITLIKCMDNDGFYGYMYSLKKINPNIIDNKKYIVIGQNGKKFNITDNTMTTKDLFTQYDAVVPKPLMLQQTVKEDYATNHNIEDLEVVEKIINEKYQSYANPLKVFLNGNILIPYNMFIMKVDDFKEYTKFIFGVLDEYLNVIDADKLKKVKDSKVGEYLAERLTNVFLIKKYTKMKTFPVIFTENKYKKPSQ